MEVTNDKQQVTKAEGGIGVTRTTNGCIDRRPENIAGEAGRS
jgi:hypothetical protein